MSYTIDYLYAKFLDQIDKEGSDIISPIQTMELLESETNNFIDETIKYIENTQQIRDLLLPLHKTYDLPLVVNPTNANEMLASLPSDYRNLETAKVIGPLVRQTKIRRKGEFNENELNPNKRATEIYPVVLLYGDVISVRGSNTFTKIQGFYITKPIFGDVSGDITTEIAVKLPDQSVEKILLLMTTAYHARNADQRFQSSYMEEQSYGKSNK